MKHEKHIVAAIISFIRSEPGCWAEKTHGGPFSAGEPDVRACVRGRSVFLEVKRAPGIPATPLQVAKLKKWELAGAIVGVVSSVEEVRQILQEHLLVDD